MRRFIVPLSLLVAAVAISILTAAGPAGASSRSPHIVCPAQDPHVSPCCPLPTGPAGSAQPVCCPSASCCTTSTPCCTTSTPCCTTNCCPASTACCAPTPCGPGSLTISSSPNPSTAGRKVVIKGGFVGTATAGAQVVLWRELAGASSFQQIAQTSTDSAGNYAFTLARGKVMADQAWYVTSGTVRSGTLQQIVAALVGLSPSAHSISAGQPIVLRGHVTPSHSGEAVLIEQKRGTTWRILGRARLGHGSSYALTHRFAKAGAYKLRAVLKADSRNELSASPSVTVSVK